MRLLKIWKEIVFILTIKTEVEDHFDTLGTIVIPKRDTLQGEFPA